MSSTAETSESIELIFPRRRLFAVSTAQRSSVWRRTLRQAVVVTDLILLLVVTGGAAVLGSLDTLRGWNLGFSVVLGAYSLAILLLCFGLFRCWDQKVLGYGAEEFNRLLRAFLTASLTLAVAGLAFKIDAVRPWVFGVLPATGIVVALGRHGIRRVLHRARRASACMATVLVVGRHESIADFAALTRRVPQHGWSVVAACTSTGVAGDGSGVIDGVPVVGDLDDVVRSSRELGVDVVAVAPAEGWSSKRLQNLAWQLEGTGIELVVDPGLMEIGGPRLHVAPVDGIPMLRLTEPRFSGVSRLAKNVFDRTAAGALVLLLAPILLVLAVLIKRDGGPVFFRQERVGLDGRAFRMIKFRSMVVEADKHLHLLSVSNEAAGPLFKMRVDPRVTRVGRTLRRLSLDELPQLFNVLGGSMSLVGPRPPLMREVATYGNDARRKLLVRPGMTGLWQVSGRSDLTWEESVRLDLRYVENWSPALDVQILCRTVGAVFRGRGAY